jgi:glutamate-1-semialdehyde 2,1-aminomutase
MAAGSATLRRLDDEAYARIEALTGRLAEGLGSLAAGRPLSVASAPGLVTLFFRAAEVSDFTAASSCDLEAHARFCRAMLERGIYPPPSQFEAWFVSLAHDEAIVDRTLEAAGDALDEALA